MLSTLAGFPTPVGASGWDLTAIDWNFKNSVIMAHGRAPHLQDVDTLGVTDLLCHQQAAWERQREVVARNSVFYQGLWDGQTPPRNLCDLPVLPLSSKAQLRTSQADHPPFGNYLASTRAKVTRLQRTSGTSGQAMNLALSARDCVITESVGARSHRAAGLGVVKQRIGLNPVRSFAASRAKNAIFDERRIRGVLHESEGSHGLVREWRSLRALLTGLST